jgi:hypothetical protein
MNTTTFPMAEPSIDRPGPYDILCGRCRLSFHHVGNRRFRVTIGLNLQQYKDAKSKREKSAVIVSVIRMLRDEVGARFLKKAKKAGFVEISAKLAHQKVGHALRDMAASQLECNMRDRPRRHEEARPLDDKPDFIESLKIMFPPSDCQHHIVDEKILGSFPVCSSDGEHFFENLQSLASPHWFPTLGELAVRDSWCTRSY